MQNDPRSRILLLLQLLLKQTDEHHYATGADILRFWETHGIQTTRKNVYSDIQLLMDFGLDVICIKSTQNRYFVGSRLLELPELKLLVDAVESSHLITEKKSTALIEKLGHLTSRHNAALLNRPVYMDGTAKPDNEAVYYASVLHPGNLWHVSRHAPAGDAAVWEPHHAKHHRSLRGGCGHGGGGRQPLPGHRGCGAHAAVLLMGIHLRRRYPHRGAWGGAGEDAGYGLVAAYIKARGIRPGNAGQIPLTFTGQEDRCGVYPRSGPPDFSPKSIPACQWM